MKAQTNRRRQRLAAAHTALAQLHAFKTLAISPRAAQHDESEVRLVGYQDHPNLG